MLALMHQVVYILFDTAWRESETAEYITSLLWSQRTHLLGCPWDALTFLKNIKHEGVSLLFGLCKGCLMSLRSLHDAHLFLVYIILKKKNPFLWPSSAYRKEDVFLILIGQWRNPCWVTNFLFFFVEYSFYFLVLPTHMSAVGDILFWLQHERL